MKADALKYYIHDGPTAFRFELAGDISREGACRLDQDWRTASSALGDRRLIVDVTFVTGIDEQARELITRWHREGARFIAGSAASRALVESILGEPLREHPANAPFPAMPDLTWLPFRYLCLWRAVTLLFLAMIVFPAAANAATLKSETVTAWDDYLRTANTNLQGRVRPGGSFLWTLENAGRAAKVRSGEIIVAPAPGQNPNRVPGGLIHHWIGAMFLSNIKLDDVLQVARDYDHYKDFYRTSVIDSKVIACSNSDDKFSMRLMNKALFLKTVLDADYQVTNVRLDDRRFYSTSTTMRVQEIQEYGQPGQRQIPEGEGTGYIWKLFSIARLEQRGDGVYLELEAIALSRDIPPALRLVVDPVVRRVSRNSVLGSLRQTAEAVGGRLAGVARPAGAQASAEHLRSVPASPSNKSSAFSTIH